MTLLPTRQRDAAGASYPVPDGVAPRAVTNVGKYRVLSELGHGGMANVYLAVTRGPSVVSKLVVLKALLPELASEPSALTAFLDEARLAAQLNHGNIVQTYEVGTEGDRHVIVMEYLEGQSLASIIKRSASAETPLSLAFHLRIIIGVLEGLQYAHELNAYDGSLLLLVHRDVSPQNVFVTYDGQVKVLDFGIAKAASSTVHTASGVIKGKISYMSPEQMAGENVDRRADVYSVGCMLWAAAAGRKLWKDRPDVQIMRAVTIGEAPSPQTANPRCDDELNGIVMKALAHDRSQRYQSALQLQEDLERYCERHSIQNRPRELGRYVSTLFADTRADLRARVEQQLSAVSLGDTALPTVDPSADSVVRGGADGRAPAVVSTHTISAISSAAVNLGSHATRSRKPAARVIVGVGFAVAVAAAFVWRMGFRAHASAVNAPEVVTPVNTESASATVELRSLPSNAQLFLDGERLVGNPSSRLLPKDGKIHVLGAESDGYQKATAQFTVTKDDAVELHLEKLETEAKTPPPPSVVRRTVKPARSKSAPAANCAQPFFIDTDGIKKLRPACL
jgi:serine/threonine protein kinase